MVEKGLRGKAITGLEKEEDTMADILIEEGIIVTVDSERRIIENGAVAIEKDRIVDVGKTDELRKKHQANVVINAQRKLVMPGFVNCHTHFQEAGKNIIPDDLISRSWLTDWKAPMIYATTPEYERYNTLMMIAWLLKTGSTCFTDIGLFHPDETMEVILQSGMRGATGTFPNWDSPGTEFGMKPGAIRVETTDECAKKWEEVFKKYNGAGNGRIKIIWALEGPGCFGATSDQMYIRAKQLADEYGVVCNFHAATSHQGVETTLARTGHRDVEHMYKLGVLGPNVMLVHVADINEEEFKMLSDNNVKIVLVPGAAIRQVKGVTRFSKYPDFIRSMRPAIGGDSVNSTATYDMVRIAQLVIGIARDIGLAIDIGAETGVEMATINGARNLGWDKEIGSLEVGKKADIILFDLRRPEWLPISNIVQNLIWGASGDSVETVIIDGKIVMENRVIKTFDEYEVLDKIQEIHEDFMKRLQKKPQSRWKVV